MTTDSKKSRSKPTAKKAATPRKPAETEEQKLAKLQKSQTVKHSFLTTNGSPVHLCEDGEFRTDEEMQQLGKEED